MCWSILAIVEVNDLRTVGGELKTEIILSATYLLWSLPFVRGKAPGSHRIKAWQQWLFVYVLTVFTWYMSQMETMSRMQ
jgi:hypothetical protein